jgi:hypothetical protein
VKTIKFRLFGVTILEIEMMTWEPVVEPESEEEDEEPEPVAFTYPERTDTVPWLQLEEGVTIFQGGTGARD